MTQATPNADYVPPFHHHAKRMRDAVRITEEPFDLIHDDHCESVDLPDGGWTPCGCAERATQIDSSGDGSAPSGARPSGAPNTQP